MANQTTLGGGFLSPPAKRRLSSESSKYKDDYDWIIMEGPPIQKFDVKPCLEKWRSVRNRRVFSGTPVQPASSIGTQA